MLLDPTERNVDPFLFPTGIRTMKKLVLTSAIHDKNVTMAETAQVSLIIRTGPTPPSEDYGPTKTHRNDEFGLTTFPKQRFVIAVPPNTRVPSPVKVQVRGGRHLSLSTPRLHQECDGPPHTSKQWPALLSSVCPDSGAFPVRIRTSARGITRWQGPTTLCGTTPSSPSLQLRQGKKKDSSLGGHTGMSSPT